MILIGVTPGMMTSEIQCRHPSGAGAWAAKKRMIGSIFVLLRQKVALKSRLGDPPFEVIGIPYAKYA